MSEDAHARTELDRLIWSKVCEENYPRLRSYAGRLTGNWDIAEDITQETVLKILRLVPNSKAVGNKLNYLLRSVHNTWVDWLKEKEYLKTTSIDDPDNEAVRKIAAPERDADIDVETDRFRQAMKIELKRLNDWERQILERFLEGYTCSEIAAQMSVDARVISYELNRVKTKVRYRVKPYIDGSEQPDSH